MAGAEPKSRASVWPGIAALVLATVYAIALLAVETQQFIMGLLALAIVAVMAANWLGLLASVGRSFADRENVLGVLAILAAFTVAAFFREDHFVLLLMTFLEVNDVLGGPQGLQVTGMRILGWSFNDNIAIRGIELSFYMSYFAVSMILLVGAFI